MTLLHDHFEKRQESILSFIRDLVEMETPSREEVRLNEMAGLVAERFRAIGGQVEQLPEPGYGTHLVANFASAENRDQSHILVLGHLDTVWPVGTLKRLPFRVTPEGTAHGPGIFDMKSGVTLTIEALSAIRSLGLGTKRPVRVLFTCDEEIGSRTSRPLVEREARGAAAALVIEPPITGGIVKTGRKGIGVFTIRAIGRAAHAGLDPSKGINAIVELAHQTLRLAALNDIEKGTTVSVGIFTGGTALNVVPAEAAAKVDVRFWTEADGERVVSAIRGLKPVLEGSDLEVTGGINRPPMQRSEKNLALFNHARSVAAEIGFELKEQAVGGGSDGNFTSAMGIATLDGLGVDGAGAHADNEHIRIADITRRATLLTRLLQTV
ncbi:MAG: M20 family metallopeptidase [Acidobacteria bacterium]|nr:M20 family metallopeptidase [Acidobacteriota bacterium]